MSKKSKHFEITFFVISFFCVVAMLIMITFIISRDDKNLKYQNLDVVFSHSDILSIENKLPISDAIGKNYEGSGMEKGIEGYTTFSITNPNKKKITYEIYMVRQKTKTNDIKSNYIKIYLTDDKNVPYKGFESKKIPSFYDFYVLKDKPGAKLLYRSTLKPKEEDKFKLRIWLADSYVLSQVKEEFSVDIDVRVK